VSSMILTTRAQRKHRTHKHIYRSERLTFSSSLIIPIIHLHLHAPDLHSNAHLDPDDRTRGSLPTDTVPGTQRRDALEHLESRLWHSFRISTFSHLRSMSCLSLLFSSFVLLHWLPARVSLSRDVHARYGGGRGGEG
jgi:hypothetical protein